MTKTPKPVVVFFDTLMIWVDEDQAQAMLLRNQIAKCGDPNAAEHYHLQHLAGLKSERGIAIDLRPVPQVAAAADTEVADMIDRCTKPGNET